MNRPLGLANRSPERVIADRIAMGWLPRGWIDGLVLSSDSTDITNDIGIAAGACRSTVSIVDGAASTLTRDQRDIEIPIAIIKQLDVAWAPENYDREGYSGGGRSGGRSASSISNTTWHVYAIGGPGVPDDILFHDSATQSSVVAALPGNYTAYRRIGSVLRESAALAPFVQHGDYFHRGAVVADVSAANPGTSAVTRTLSVPIGIRVLADVFVAANNAAAAQSPEVLLSDLEGTDATPSTTHAHISTTVAAAGFPTTICLPATVRTNTSAQIRSRASDTSANFTLSITTRGWWDQRDRNA